MANPHSIHLVSKTPKPQPLDPVDIAAAVLDTVRDCTKSLRDFEEYQQWLVNQMSGELKALELTALRTMTKKARRS